MSRLFLVLLLAIPGVVGATSQRHWFTLAIEDQRVGYASREYTVKNGNNVYTEHVRIEITQFRRRATIERRMDLVRAPDDRPLRIAVDSKAGADRGTWRGEFDPRGTQLEVHAADSAQPVEVALPPSVQMPDRLGTALSPLWRREVSELNVPYLDPAEGGPVSLEAAATADHAVGDSVRIDVRIRGPRSTHRETLWFDAQGNLLRIEQPFFGAVLAWTACSSECDSRVDKPFDPMARLTVRSPFRISSAAAKGAIRYVISHVDGVEPRLIETGEQVVVRNGQRSVVTVCERCAANVPMQEEDVSSYLAANAWVQSSHPEIRAFAKRAAVGDSVRRRMDRLTDAVRSHMTGQIDFLGYASALEAMRHRSGDCTEIAVLLAAAARAEGIPARIVIGVVYADRFSGKKDVFSPHAWVQAWDGKRWTSYDAALDGFDATHIAMAVGNGDPRQFEDAFAQLPKWRIENAGAIKAQ